MRKRKCIKIRLYELSIINNQNENLRYQVSITNKEKEKKENRLTNLKENMEELAKVSFVGMVALKQRNDCLQRQVSLI